MLKAALKWIRDRFGSSVHAQATNTGKKDLCPVCGSDDSEPSEDRFLEFDRTADGKLIIKDGRALMRDAVLRGRRCRSCSNRFATSPFVAEGYDPTWGDRPKLAEGPLQTA